jgi:hypothetical protein
MKNAIILFLLCLAMAAPAAAQQITAPADSIPVLLCKKWQVSYALADNMKLEMKPGAQSMDYEFNQDKTAWVSAPGIPKTKASWAYDAATKTIKVTINGVSRIKIVGLQADQLTMSIDTKDATPDAPMPITMVYKVKTQ